MNMIILKVSRYWIAQSAPCKHFTNRTCFESCSKLYLKWKKRMLCSSVKTDNVKETINDIPLSRIRNFSIIAHVDHGKSTLADRLLEMTGAVDVKSTHSQVLDKLQVERERGITVKAQTVSLCYNFEGENYMLNLIDTPGHVDFSNEVSRSLEASQGVILLVDANQGVQAQTVANFSLAYSKELIIIPVLNKIDLKYADPEGVSQQLHNLFGIKFEDILKISAKHGTGVEDLIKAIIQRIPPPSVNRIAPFRALLYDSWYDKYRGVVILVYITDGTVHVGDTIKSVHTGKTYGVRQLGLLRPQEELVETLHAGQVGFITCNMRSTKEAHIGDTICNSKEPTSALPNLEPIRPMVFAGIYPMDQSEHNDLRNAIEKLILNDPAVTVAIDSSPALGQGWRLGFLGILHLEVFSQRLEQEYGAHAVITAPNVTYKAIYNASKSRKEEGTEISFSNPLKCPDRLVVSEYLEPFVLGTIVTPDSYIGAIVAFCMDRRGIQKSSTYIDDKNVMIQFILPLNEIIFDFHDHIKSLSSGFASVDYEDYGYQPSSITQLNILLNGTVVEELCTIVHTSKANLLGRQMCAKLKDIIPRQLIQIAIQAVVGGKVVARENIKAYRKDVTAKLYGGDVTRRKKLLKQQAEGKKKMRMVANISLPRETFINVLKR